MGKYYETFLPEFDKKPIKEKDILGECRDFVSTSTLILNRTKTILHVYDLEILLTFFNVT